MSMLCVTLRAFIPIATSYGWAWGPWRDAEALAEETLNAVLELPRVLRTYASTVATLIRGEAAGDRFNVTAYGSCSDLVYGRDHWVWDARLGLYTAHGEPWVPRTVEAPQDVFQGGLEAIPMPRRTVSAQAPRLAA